MEIKRIGSQLSGEGHADWFTGRVRIDSLFEAPEPARVRGASVTFEPGARTAWHTHPLGQTLIVTSGLGWVQRWGGPIGRLSRLLHGADATHKPRQLPASQETPASVGACHFH
jgi:quercetin dioxygenase-like cupin family protein